MQFEEALIELRKGKSIKRKEEQHWTHNIIFNTLKVSFMDILSDDWEVIEEPGKTFPEVFEAFKEGKKIKRKQWIHYAFIRKINDAVDSLTIADLLATDWIILED